MKQLPNYVLSWLIRVEEYESPEFCCGLGFGRNDGSGLGFGTDYGFYDIYYNMGFGYGYREYPKNLLVKT